MSYSKYGGGSAGSGYSAYDSGRRDSSLSGLTYSTSRYGTDHGSSRYSSTGSRDYTSPYSSTSATRDYSSPLTRDYSTTSRYSTPTSRDYTSGRDYSTKDYGTRSSRYPDSLRYESSRLNSSFDRQNSKRTSIGGRKDSRASDDESSVPAVVVKEEVDEPVEEENHADENYSVEDQEVLQESDVDHFRDHHQEEEYEDEVEDSIQQEEVEEVEEVPVEVEDADVEQPNDEVEQERVREVNSPRSPARHTPSPVYQQRQSQDESNPKKLGGGVWPPPQGMSRQNTVDDKELPKKKVSDLIAKFNSGAVINEGGKQENGKSESRNVGRINQEVFH